MVNSPYERLIIAAFIFLVIFSSGCIDSSTSERDIEENVEEIGSNNLTG
jgi:outer membrane lipoprotein-sorting protein